MLAALVICGSSALGENVLYNDRNAAATRIPHSSCNSALEFSSLMPCISFKNMQVSPNHPLWCQSCLYWNPRQDFTFRLGACSSVAWQWTGAQPATMNTSLLYMSLPQPFFCSSFPLTLRVFFFPWLLSNASSTVSLRSWPASFLEECHHSH